MNVKRQRVLSGTGDNSWFSEIPAYRSVTVLADRAYRKMTFINEQLRFVRSLRIVIASLADNPRAAFVGFAHILFLVVLWEIAVLLWAPGGATVTMPAFLKIPVEQYYFYQLILLIPMFVVTRVLASGTAYVFSRAFGGNGFFDAILGGFGVTAPFAGYFALVPDYVQGILRTIGWLPLTDYRELTSNAFPTVLVWSYLLACNFVYLLLYSMTIHLSQNLSRTNSVLVGATACIVSSFFFVVIVR